MRKDHSVAFTMYKETLGLVRVTTRPSRNSEFGTDNKLAILSLRCQSLLNLKLYKLRKHEMRECQQKLEDLIEKASNATSDLSPNPSPAGSEGSVCSKSSGYTSAGELPMGPGGVLTPPALPTGGLAPGGAAGGMTVQIPLMQKHHQYSNFLTQCHELWEMAEVVTQRGHCQGLFDSF